MMKFSSLCTACFYKCCYPPEHDICFSDRNLCFTTVASLCNTSDNVSYESHRFRCKPFVPVRDVAWNVFEVCLTAETNGRVETLACYSLFLELVLTSQHKMHRVNEIALMLFH